MRMQEMILQRQNTEDMLKCQYSARFYYNRAEKLFWTIVFLSVINIIIVLLPDFQNDSMKTVFRIIPGIICFIVIVLFCSMRKRITQAADLRDFFDMRVLGLPVSVKYREETIQILINNAISKSETESIVQMKNDGHDDPPGVKNWYTFTEQYADDEVVYRCQRQNNYWTYELSHKKYLLFGICFVFLILFGIVLCICFNADWIKVLLCLISAASFLIERLIDEKRFYNQIVRIKHNCEFCEKTRTPEQIEQLQLLISELRHMPVVGINQLHKRNASNLTALYEKISKRIR